MRVTLLPSTIATWGQFQHLTSFLINDSIAIDAGCLGFCGDLARQARVRHVLLSHSHLDHVASLPMFLENVFSTGAPAPTVYASQTTLDCLRRDYFNDRVWPDFVRISEHGPMFLKIIVLEPEKTLELEGVKITPVPVHHAVPTLGFVIEDDRSAVVISSDTGPTERIWQIADALPNLRGVFLETAFPNRLAELARLSGHNTPATFAKEMAKVGAEAPFFAYHLKAGFREELVRELAAIERAAPAEPGEEYTF